MTVTNSGGTNINRQVLEGIQISEAIRERDRATNEKHREKVLNSARQWIQHGLIKVKPMKNIYE